MKNKQKVVQLILVISLVLLFILSLVWERCPYHDGAGWDGVLYRSMTENFWNQLINGEGYSHYYIQKCLPFALINGVDILLGITQHIYTLYVFLFITLGLSVCAFFKISKSLQLSIRAEIIAFALTFFTFPILKGVGYLPYQGDFFAICISLWIYYFYITNQKYSMLAISILGAFTWQAIFPISILLFMLPNNKLELFSGKDVSPKMNVINRILKMVIVIGSFAIPLKMFEHASRKYGDINMFWVDIPYFYIDNLPIWVACIAVVLLTILLYFAIRPFNCNLPKVLMNIIKDIKIQNIIIGVASFILIRYCIQFLGNGSEGAYDSIIFTCRRILWEPYTIPLKFAETQFIYSGLLLPLFIVFYKEIWEYVSAKGTGYVVLIVGMMMLGTQTESRFVLSLLPFLLFAVCKVLSKRNRIRIADLAAVVIMQLLMSFFWLKINMPTILEAFEKDDNVSYLTSEAQRYFFTMGPWQGMTAYYIFITLFLITIGVVYVRKKDFWSKVREE